jgi:hypothetical protein
MGFFGWVSEKISAAKEWVSEKVSEAKEWVSEKVSSVKEKVTNSWNKFTGKKTFEEAEELYEKITERYNSRRKRFETEINNYTNRIEKHVEVINQSKEKIKRELFPEMAKKLEKIKDITVSDDFSVEAYMAAALSFDSVRTKSELYKIDFNKHKFKTTVQAIFTLGFYTRKKAKETLYAVQEEEKKIDNEIAKMDAEIVKLKAIEQSLDNVEIYFTALIEIYGNLLIRLDNSVNFLYVRSMAFAHKLVHQEMSIRRLPVMQRKEVEAIITASKLLKAMADAQLTSIEEYDKVNSYSKNMKEQHAEMQKVYRAA